MKFLLVESFDKTFTVGDTLYYCTPDIVDGKIICSNVGIQLTKDLKTAKIINLQKGVNTYKPYKVTLLQTLKPFVINNVDIWSVDTLQNILLKNNFLDNFSNNNLITDNNLFSFLQLGQLLEKQNFNCIIYTQDELKTPVLVLWNNAMISTVNNL